MFKFIILTLAIYSYSALADEQRVIDMDTMDSQQVEDACRLEASEFGSLIEGNLPKSTIHPECRKYINSTASQSQRTQSKDGKVTILAGLNIIYIDIETTENNKSVIKHNIISGPMAKLETIESIVISRDSKKLAVIHKILNGIHMDKNKKNAGKKETYKLEKELLIFNATMSGNVAPIRYLREGEINNASAMAFHPNGKEIYLTNAKNNQIITYSTDADYRLSDDEKKPKVVRRFTPSNKTFRSPSSIDFMGNSLLVLDAEDNRIIALDTKTNTAQWAIEREEIGLKYLSHLRYEQHNKKLLIFDEEGNSVSFDQN